MRLFKVYNMKVNISGGEHKEPSNVGSEWGAPEGAVGETQIKKGGLGEPVRHI